MLGEADLETAAGTPRWAVAMRPATPANADDCGEDVIARLSTTSPAVTEQQAGVVEQRSDVQARAEHDEEERDKEAFRDAADLSRQAPRPSDRSHHEPYAESGQEHAGAALLSDPSQTEQNGQ